MMINYETINSAYSYCLSGKTPLKDDIKYMLDIDSCSSEAVYLRETAYRAALMITGSNAYVGAGAEPECIECFQNCKIVLPNTNSSDIKGRRCGSVEKLSEKVKSRVVDGSRFIYLDFDDFYSLEDLYRKTKRIKAEVTGNYKLLLNIDINNISTNELRKLCDAGIDAVCIANADDLEKFRQIRNNMTDLNPEFVYGIDYTGDYYTDDELADIILQCVDNVPAAIMITFGNNEEREISENRAAQIIAVIRLAVGRRIKNIGVSCLFNKAMISGANVAVLPDKNNHSQGSETDNIPAIKEVIYNAGYKL